MLKLVRDTKYVNVIDPKGQVIGQVTFDELDKCQCKPGVKGFVRKARVLWVNYINPSQVNDFSVFISLKI